MECTYIGNFDVHHLKKKKTSNWASKIKKATSSVVIENVSSETFREKEANRIMKNGRNINAF